MNTSCCLYVFFALICIHFPIGVHQQKQTQTDGKITTVPPKVTTTQEFSTAAPNFNSANTTQVNQLLSTTGTSMFVMLYQSKVLCDAINSIPNVPWFAYPIVKFATLTDTEKSLYCGKTFLKGNFIANFSYRIIDTTHGYSDRGSSKNEGINRLCGPNDR